MQLSDMIWSYCISFSFWLHEMIHGNNGLEKLLAEEVILKSCEPSTQTTVCSHRVIQKCLEDVFCSLSSFLCRSFIPT